MATEYVDLLRPRDLYPENGLQVQTLVLPNAADVPALPLNKLANFGYTAISRIPAALTVGTGLTFTVLVTDDGSDPADLGKVVRLGITVREILTTADELDLDASAATEATADVTLDATSGQVVIGSIAIANAALDSIGAGDYFAFRIRRLADHANDTAPGRVALVAVGIANT